MRASQKFFITSVLSGAAGKDYYCIPDMEVIIMTNETKRIMKEIVRLQRRLVELIGQRDTADGEVLGASRALDRLINDYHRHNQGDGSFD